MVISEVTAFLEDAFDVLNQKYFEGSLPRAVITIQSSPKAYGHFTPYEAWFDNGDGFPEINLGAETLNRPTESTIGTLIHEMVHFYCHVNEIKDTSRGGKYHNKRFKAEAESRDLIIDYDPRIGWSVTSPSQALIDFVREQGWSEVSLARMGLYGLVGGQNGTGTDGGESVAKKKAVSHKYQCPVCKNSVRATKLVNIGCLDCNSPMDLVS